MASRKALVALTRADQAALLRQWYQSGKCLRCFHASRPRAVGEDNSGSRDQGEGNGNDRGTPYNKPLRGPNRHQRAAQISEELRMLNRDTVNIGTSRPSNENPEDYAIGPQGIGSLPLPDAMGANDSPEREGPLAQGVASMAHGRREEESLGNEVSQVRGVRMPGGRLEDPKRGGAGVLQSDNSPSANPGPERLPVSSSHEKDTEGQEELPEQASIPTAQPYATMREMQHAKLPGHKFQPKPFKREDLVDAGNHSSTLAASNFVGVINDHIRHIVEPGVDQSRRDVRALAGKQLAKQLVRFTSEEEKEMVLAHADELRARGLTDMYLSDEEKFAKKKGEQQESSDQESQDGAWEPLPEKARASLVRKMVNGHYDEAGLLQGKEVHKQKVLNEIARMTLRNETYLRSDGARLLAKVQSLLPSVAAQQAKGQTKVAKPQQTA